MDAVAAEVALQLDAPSIQRKCAALNAVCAAPDHAGIAESILQIPLQRQLSQHNVHCARIRRDVHSVQCRAERQHFSLKAGIRAQAHQPHDLAARKLAVTFD